MKVCLQCGIPTDERYCVDCRARLEQVKVIINEEERMYRLAARIIGKIGFPRSPYQHEPLHSDFY